MLLFETLNKFVGGVFYHFTSLCRLRVNIGLEASVIAALRIRLCILHVPEVINTFPEESRLADSW